MVNKPIAAKLLLVFTVLLFSSIVTPSAFAEKKSAEQLRAKIEKIRHKLKTQEGRKHRYEVDLEETDKLISIKSRTISKLKKQVHESRKKLKSLQREKQRYLQQADLNQDAIKQEIRYAYYLSKQHPVKVLLNLDNPSEMGRDLTYYQYFGRARNEALARLSAKLEKATQIEHELSTETQSLDQAVASLDRETTQLKQNRTIQTQIIRKIELAMQDQQQALAKFRADESRLSQLTEAINEISGDVDKSASGIAFADQKGKLGWPVSGKVSESFGNWRSQGQIKWKGWLIDTPAGSAVKAVWPGRVVFSDWLRGYGFLVIVDHGAGYMSLYAHNQTLLKTTGDAVALDETIATAGNSGGQSESSLYFEIRKDGKALDPANWIVAKR